MSSVTSCWVIVPSRGDGDRGHPEGRIKEIAEFIQRWIYDDKGWSTFNHWPTIDLMRDDWATLQGGSKVAGMAALWFGWNYAQPEELIDALRDSGIADGVTFIHQHENADDMEVARL